MRRRGTADVAEIVHRGLVARAPVSEAVAARTPVPLAAISTDAWRGLSARAIEPNGYYLPDWELAVNASAPGRTGASALCAWSETAAPALVGLFPVVPL